MRRHRCTEAGMDDFNVDLTLVFTDFDSECCQSRQIFSFFIYTTTINWWNFKVRAPFVMFSRLSRALGCIAQVTALTYFAIGI